MKVFFSENPLNCDCELAYFKDWSSQHRSNGGGGENGTNGGESGTNSSGGGIESGRCATPAVLANAPVSMVNLTITGNRFLYKSWTKLIFLLFSQILTIKKLTANC